MHWMAAIIREALIRWGYFAIIVGLLGEDAGLPLPGESILMFASFLARKTDYLGLATLILVGISAAIAGDNLGFVVGRHFGPRLLRWLEEKFHLDDDIAAAADQLCRHGAATVFWAKYIVGFRTMAGPVSGALGMQWKRFFIFDALGAATWVTTIALIGYYFAAQFETLLDYMERFSWIVSGCIFGTGYILWRRQKKQFKRRESLPPEEQTPRSQACIYAAEKSSPSNSGQPR